jgi:CHAT domain-containing protein
VGGVDYDERDELYARVPSLAEGVPERSFTSFWEPLRATRGEASAIEALHRVVFGEREERLLLFGKEPTEERLKVELPRFYYVHLATHGFFVPEGMPSILSTVRARETGRPQEEITPDDATLTGLLAGYFSSLVCAGANSPCEGRDNAFLSAEEISWLDLENVDLVVLSACETGIGRAESGEGMIGLRRNLRQAGVKTVISSLWKVDDEATAELMKRLYVNLWQKKMGKLDALRDAELSMLEENRAKHKDPRPETWGAFVLDGVWR